MVSIKRVSYGFNSLLEQPYFLDVLVQEDRKVLVDEHGSFKTLGEFEEKVNGIVPVLEEAQKDEDR